MDPDPQVENGEFAVPTGSDLESVLNGKILTCVTFTNFLITEIVSDTHQCVCVRVRMQTPSFQGDQVLKSVLRFCLCSQSQIRKGR